MTWIVEEPVIWVYPSGERSPGRIALGAPEPDARFAHDTTMACRWFLEGLWKEPRQAFGEGTMQPLMLALQMIGYELHDFISRGGRVEAPDEQGFAGVLMSLRLLLRRAGDEPAADPALAELDAEIADARRRFEEERAKLERDET